MLYDEFDNDTEYIRFYCQDCERDFIAPTDTMSCLRCGSEDIEEAEE